MANQSKVSYSTAYAHVMIKNAVYICPSTMTEAYITHVRYNRCAQSQQEFNA